MSLPAFTAASLSCTSSRFPFHSRMGCDLRCRAPQLAFWTRPTSTTAPAFPRWHVSRHENHLCTHANRNVAPPSCTPSYSQLTLDPLSHSLPHLSLFLVPACTLAHVKGAREEASESRCAVRRHQQSPYLRALTHLASSTSILLFSRLPPSFNGQAHETELTLE